MSVCIGLVATTKIQQKRLVIPLQLNAVSMRAIRSSIRSQAGRATPSNCRTPGTAPVPGTGSLLEKRDVRDAKALRAFWQVPNSEAPFVS